MPETIQPLINNDFSKLIFAFLLALPIAYNREQSTKIMGLRTYPLVSIATCAYVIIGAIFIEASESGAQARVLQGLLAGIGFIGGGAILKKEDKVLGTASAASIWMTGAIGVAVAYGRYDIALFLSLATYGVLRWLTPLKSRIHHEDENGEEPPVP